MPLSDKARLIDFVKFRGAVSDFRMSIIVVSQDSVLSFDKGKVYHLLIHIFQHHSLSSLHIQLLEPR